MQAFIGTGFNLVLSFNPLPGFDPRFRQMDFEKEPGRVRKTDDISPIIISRALPLLHSSSIPSPSIRYIILFLYSFFIFPPFPLPSPVLPSLPRFVGNRWG